MSKRLPYFQFEPAEYLAGDIMFCSYASQGMFNNICALYWQKDCKLSYSQTIKRLGNEDLIKELISENIIKVEVDAIIINFLDEQYNKATSKSNTNSENGKKGAQKRWRKDSEIIATPLNNDSESIALREDEIKEDNIIEDKEDNNFLLKKETKEVFSEIEILPINNQEQKRKKVAPKKEINLPTEFIEIWDLWIEYRTAKKIKNYANDKFEQMAIDKLLKFSNNNPIIAKEIINESITNSWTGFFELKTKQTNGEQITTKQQFRFSSSEAVKTITGGN